MQMLERRLVAHSLPRSKSRNQVKHRKRITQSPIRFLAYQMQCLLLISNTFLIRNMF